MSVTAASGGIATPAGSGGVIAGLLAEQRVPATVARIGAWLGAVLGRPLRIRGTVIVTSHSQVTEALSRDLDFRIAPVNEARIEAVNGPFVLGMDRGATLVHERRALYEALAGVDFNALRSAAAEQAEALIGASTGQLDAVSGYARLVAAGTAQRLFGIGAGDTQPADAQTFLADAQTFPADAQTFMDVSRAVFAHVFLNISGDKAVEARALQASVLMRNWLDAEIARRRAAEQFGIDMMGRLLQGRQLDDEGVRRTLGGMLVGAIDTTASAVAKIAAMIGRDARFGKQVAADVDDPVRLAGWCREALRRWPHNPILLRQAQTNTTLAGTAIRAGDKVVIWTQAAMLDSSMFPNPGTWRADRPATAYLHFGGGLHPCAGRAVNEWQIPLLVGALVRRGIRSVGPVAWAGPFPDHLPITFER
jgi:cytochrome P450